MKKLKPGSTLVKAKTATKRTKPGVDIKNMSASVTNKSSIAIATDHSVSDDVEFSDVDSACDDEVLRGAMFENFKDTTSPTDLESTSSTVNKTDKASASVKSAARITRRSAFNGALHDTLNEVDKGLLEWNNTNKSSKLMKASNTQHKRCVEGRSNLMSPKPLEKNPMRKAKRIKFDKTKKMPLKHLNMTKLTRITWVNDQIHCYICEYQTGVEKILDSKKDFYRHALATHGEKDAENRQIIRCPICGIYTVEIKEPKDGRLLGYFQYQLPRHMQHMVNAHQWTIPEYVRTFPCNQPGCSYIAVTSNILRCHQQQNHEKSQCDRCGRVIATSAMRRHRETCIVERKFKCTVCSKTMKRKSHLNHHMKTVHSNEKDSVCYVCSSVVKSEHGLHYHLFIKHGITEGRPIIYCDQCEFQTICAVRLKSHIQTNHSEPVVLPCPKCGAVFRRRGIVSLFTIRVTIIC